MPSTAIVESTTTDAGLVNTAKHRLVTGWNRKSSSRTFSTPSDPPSYGRIGNHWIKWDEFTSPASKHIDNLFLLMRFPKKWSLEGIAEPTTACKNLASDTAKQLYFRENLIPIRILPSIEEGIMLTYHNPENNKTMMIEIYNDLDIAGIVNQNKTILLSQDIEDENYKDLVNIFNEDT